MMNRKRNIKLKSYMALDIIGIVIAVMMIDLIMDSWYGHGTSIGLNLMEQIGAIVILSFINFVCFYVLEIYDNVIIENGFISNSIALRMLMTNALMGIVLFKITVDLKIDMINGYIISVLGTIIIWQQLSRFIYYHIHSNKKMEFYDAVNALVVGQSAYSKQYFSKMGKYGYLHKNYVGYISVDGDEHYSELKHLGTLSELTQVVWDNTIDEVIVALPLGHSDALKEEIKNCQSMGITVTMVLNLISAPEYNLQIELVEDSPLLKFQLASFNEFQLLIKRLMDILGAIFGILIFLILFLIFGPLIKLESKGPIIYKQERVGKHGRIFYIWKFRTMVDNADELKDTLMDQNEMKGNMFKMKNDPRITKIGSFLRRFSIDEFPQFVNVFLGDMSLVGTRPPTVKEVQNYENKQKSRISITPGVTGIWQVSGRSKIKDFEDVLKLDLEYIKNWSIMLDIKILLKTFIVIFKKDESM